MAKYELGHKCQVMMSWNFQIHGLTDNDIWFVQYKLYMITEKEQTISY